jgi:hypothetical protein
MDSKKKKIKIKCSNKKMMLSQKLINRGKKSRIKIKKLIKMKNLIKLKDSNKQISNVISNLKLNKNFYN